MTVWLQIILLIFDFFLLLLFRRFLILLSFLDYLVCSSGFLTFIWLNSNLVILLFRILLTEIAKFWSLCSCYKCTWRDSFLLRCKHCQLSLDSINGYFLDDHGHSQQLVVLLSINMVEPSLRVFQTAFARGAVERRCGAWPWCSCSCYLTFSCCCSREWCPQLWLLYLLSVDGEGFPNRSLWLEVAIHRLEVFALYWGWLGALFRGLAGNGRRRRRGFLW